MNETLAIKDKVLESLTQLVGSVLDALPRVVAGIVLLVLALLVAKVIEKVLRALLRRMKVDKALEKIGVTSTLRRFGIDKPAHELVPRLVYFLLLFLFAQTAASALGLAPISNAIGSFFAYLPNLVAAMALLLVGSLAGQFAGAAVSRAAKESGIDYGAAMGRLVSTLILVVAAIMAVGQLQIDTEILRIVTTCLLAGLGLAFGLTFGLGTQKITRAIVLGFYARKLFRVGDEIEFRGEKATLSAITPTQAVLERGEERLVVPNDALMDEVVKTS